MTISLSSTPIEAKTLPSAPTVSSPSSISANSFIANFSLGGYSGKIFVKNSSNVVLGSWDGISISGSTKLVNSGLSGDTQYQYQVSKTGTYDDSALSLSSGLFYTLPDAPTVSAASSITGFSFTANFSSDSDWLYLYKAGILESGYPIAVSGTSQPIAGLTVNTAYTYKTVAESHSQLSDFSSPQSVTTADGLPAGLVGKFTFDSGNANNSSGNGNDLVPTAITFPGNTAYFDGVVGAPFAMASCRLSLPAAIYNVLNTTGNSLTICMWVNFEDLAGHPDNYLISSNVIDTIRYSKTLNQLRYNSGLSQAATLSSNTWYFIAIRATKANAGSSIVDFRFNGTTTAGGSSSPGPAFIRLGFYTSSGNDSVHKGNIDGVSMFDRYLSNSELSGVEALGRFI
jgi:chitodextrinase